MGAPESPLSGGGDHTGQKGRFGMEHTQRNIAMSAARDMVAQGDWIVFATSTSVGVDYACVGPVDGSACYVMPWHIQGRPEADDQTVNADVFTPSPYEGGVGASTADLPEGCDNSYRRKVSGMRNALLFAAQIAAKGWMDAITAEDVMVEFTP